MLPYGLVELSWVLMLPYVLVELSWVLMLPYEQCIH
jgi:hypothetical protein